MNDERIFGPLTLKQFIYAVIGIAGIYYVYNYLGASIGIPLAILIAVFAALIIKNSNPPPFNESYIRQKRSELGKEEFLRWCQKKIAMIQAQMFFREQRGLIADPALGRMKDLIESIQRES